MGLDNFKKDDEPEKDDNVKKEKLQGGFTDHTPPNWNDMPEVERVSHIREHAVEDFKPSVKIGEGWDWEKAVLIVCSCGNKLFTNSSVVCGKCETEYEYTGRTVRNKTAEQEHIE